MGKRQRDCADCGAPVGFLTRQLCCRCMRRLAEDAARAPCPGCGKRRVLQDGTGRCVACSRACTGCGHPVRPEGTALCRDCRRRARQQAARQDCPKCGRPGLLRELTGWCGHCSRPRQGRQPPRICSGCGELRRHAAAGLCSPCWQRQRPDLPRRPHRSRKASRHHELSRNPLASKPVLAPEPMQFRRCLTQVHANICALLNAALDATAMEAFSSRSVNTWNSSSAPRRSSSI